MKNLVTLNFKYLMEGREDDLQEDMEKFVDDLDDEILSLKELALKESLLAQKNINQERPCLNALKELELE